MERKKITPSDGNVPVIPENVIIPRPDEALSVLMTSLAPACRMKTLQPRQLLKLNTREGKICSLLFEGCVSVLRHNNGLRVATSYAPMVLGLADLLIPNEFHYLRAETVVEIGIINEEDVLEILNSQPELWRTAAQLLSWIVQRLSQRDIQLSDRNAYRVIRSVLMQLYIEPAEIRGNISVAQYIIERTMISRSSVMAILSSLRKGEFIIMEDGFLRDLKTLPENF